MSDAKERAEDRDVYSESEPDNTVKPSSAQELSARRQETPNLNCAHCGKPMLEDKRFCVYCGAPTGLNADSIACPACGDLMPIGTLFCGSCGMSLRASSPISFSGTGTLSFGTPSRIIQPERHRRAWLGVGVTATALVMGGLGVFIGARLFRGANPRIGRHAQLDVSSPSPFPLPGKNETSQSQERPGAETAKPAGDSGGEAQQTSPGASPLPLSAESATEKASLGPVGFSPPAKASTGSVSAEALPPSLEQSNPLVGLLPPSASPADLLPGRHKIIAKANVPIRDSPTVTAKIIAERGPGQTVLVTKVFGQWVEIRSKKGTAGYIPREVIAVELLPEEKQQSAVPAPKG